MKIKFPQKYRLGQLLYNKKFTVVLSVVLAFALWLGISMTENPIRQQTFSDLSALVTLDGTAAADLGLGIVSDVASQRFSVTISGPNYIVSSLKAEDFSLSASTVEINSAGTYNLKLAASNNSNKSGFTISKITPSTIDVTVDFIDTKEFTLVPKLIGVSAAEGLVAETPVISDSQQNTLTIRGPRSTIDKIASVASFKEVNETLSTSQTFDADVVLYDSNDKVLYRYTSDGTVYDANDNIITNSYLSLTFTNVKVTQPISKRKTVVCKPVFNNLPAGLAVDDIRYSLNQNKVTIIGTPEIVDKIENISLSAIDFRNVSTKAVHFEVSAILPDGVKFLESIENVFTVDIDASQYAEVTLDIKNIRCLGLNSELKAKTDKQIKNVKLCGPAKIIKNLKASDLYAVVDLTDKTAGDYTVEVIIKSDVYDEVWQIGTYSTSITLY
ncbi:MAG: hypothetical protein E7521_06945 [Ruminococcaceae bacterium]|nr:hypothetical protein [Oscillospiraceae bacterium]